MYCNKCGVIIPEDSEHCANCGAAKSGGNTEAVTYDYKAVQVSRRTASEVVDCYENLGWELINNSDTFSPLSTSLSFKRKRKTKNKEQLGRIQVRLDDALESLNVMERNKTKKAFAAAIFVGVIGLLLLGGGMSIIMAFGEPKVWMWVVGCLLGVIGFGVCGLGYLTYVKICAKKTAEMNVLIEKKRDDISGLCEEAQRLLS